MLYSFLFMGFLALLLLLLLVSIFLFCRHSLFLPFSACHLSYSLLRIFFSFLCLFKINSIPSLLSFPLCTSLAADGTPCPFALALHLLCTWPCFCSCLCPLLLTIAKLLMSSPPIKAWAFPLPILLSLSPVSTLGHLLPTLVLGALGRWGWSGCGLNFLSNRPKETFSFLKKSFK